MNKPATYVTDGISQRDRYPASLDPGYFNIDERTTNDLLLFVTELSFKYNYYDHNNEVDGDWLDFFLSDPNLMLRLLSSFDFARYELEYTRNKQQLLKAASEDELKEILKRIIEQICEFIYFQHGIFEKFKTSILDQHSEKLLNLQKIIDSEDAYAKARLDFYGIASYYANRLNIEFINVQQLDNLVSKASKTNSYNTYMQSSSSPFENDADAAFFENLYGRGLDVFDNLFIKFDVVYNQLKETSAFLQEEKQREKIYHQPHTSLLFSFLELYQVLKQEMNLFTGKHLDLYFKKLLEIETRKAEADKVSVILSLNKGVDEYLLEQGEPLLATIPGKAEKELFSLKEDILVTPAAIAEVKTIYKREYAKHKNESGNTQIDYVVYAADNPITPAEDYIKKNYQRQSWPLFGEDQKYLSKEQQSMQMADMGLLISAPVLFAADGKRTFTIKIQLKKQFVRDENSEDLLDPDVLGKSFIIDATCTAQWYSIKEYHVISYINGAAERFIKIEFALRPDEPAVVAYKPDVHGTGMYFRNPVIRLLQNFNTLHNPFTFFQEQQIERITINLRVKGSKRLQMQNNAGRVSASNPFQLFGPIPAVGNYLDISNPDIFNRFTKSFDVLLKWENLPGNVGGFTDYYSGYDNDITNESFKVRLSSGTDKDNPDYNRDQAVSDLFVMNRNEFSQYLQNNTTISRSGFPGVRFENDLKLLEVEDAKPDFRTGTVRLELAAPADAFCHQLYPVIFPKVLMHNSKWYVFKQKPTPNPPYAPVVNAVVVNYELEHSEIISDRKGNDVKSVVELHHIYPFGHKKIYPQEMQEPVNLIPAVANQCNLFIGLADVSPGKCLTLLFQLDENNFASLEENVQPVKWHYLNRNKWEEIDKENILEDNTYGFKGTGTVKILMPEDISVANTLLNPAYYWIRISCDNENKSRVTGIFTQVATAIRVLGQMNGSEELLLLEPDRIKEFSRQVPEIRSMIQPFYSYHGQVSETISRYYSRVSENLRHKNRVVTATDISQKILDEFPDIHKVLCFNNSANKTGNQAGENIMVVVIPEVKASADDDLAEEPRANTYDLFKIQRYLNEIVSPAVKVNVYNPVYEKIKVICSVRFKKGNKYENTGVLIQKLNLEIRKFITPWLYKRDLDINTGSGIYPGEILNLIKDQPYVDAVKGFNVVHFYKHYDAETGDTGGRLMESYYLNKHSDNDSFRPQKPLSDIKLILKASKPGAILISSLQHMITAIDNTKTGVEIKDEVANTKSGIGTLAIGEEFLVMNPYQVTEYEGISLSQDIVDNDNFDFIF